MGCTASVPRKSLRNALLNSTPPPIFHSEVTDTSPVRVVVRIIRARNLLGKDSNGTSDPYAVLNYGLQFFRTEVIQCSCDPVWSHSEFAIDPYFLPHTLGGKRDQIFSEKFIRIDLFDDDSIQHGDSKVDADGQDDFLGRVDLQLPLWEHESQKWYLLRQRSKRSRVTGEVQVFVKVEIVGKDAPSRIPSLKTNKKRLHIMRPLPSSNEAGQRVIVRARVFNEYFALPQYYCEVHREILILRLDAELPPVFVVLKSLVISSSLQCVLVNGKDMLVRMDIALRGFPFKITLESSVDHEDEMNLFFASPLAEKPSEAFMFPKRNLHIMPQFFGCGQEYYSSLYDSLIEAKEFIFIAGWMFTPEIFLKRDVFPWESRFRLETLLKEKAEQGVKVFVLIYNDRDVVGVNALHVVESLANLHSNMHVAFHGPTKMRDIYWSHHTKLVVVDWNVAFVGGIDLCVGRYDTPLHPVVDANVPFVWLGADYYNPRIHGLEKLDVPFVERFDRYLEPRLPWQDCAAKYEGDIAIDCGNYFIHRWTFGLLTRGFLRKQSKLAWILPPLHVRSKTSVEMEMVDAHALGNSVRQLQADSEVETSPTPPPIETTTSTTTAQLLRSFPAWAGCIAHEGYERSIYTTMMDQIGRAEKFIYVENQFFISSTQDEEKGGGVGAAAVMTAPLRQATSKICQKINPGYFVKKVRAQVFYQLKQRETAKQRKQRDSFSRLDESPDHQEGNVLGQHEEEDEEDENEYKIGGSGDGSNGGGATGAKAKLKAMGASTKHFHLHRPHIRKHFKKKYRPTSDWRATHVVNKISLALYKRIARAIRLKEDFFVGIVLPDFPEGHYSTEPYTRVVMHFQQHTICRGPHSLLGRLMEEFPECELSDYIQFYSLRSFGFVGHYPLQESVYVHSKLMICDDKVSIIGSANINDRSLLGSRDSETAVLVETEGSVIQDFRKTLWARHLGIDVSDDVLNDPVTCFRELWTKRSRSNTEIFESVWPSMPSSRLRTLAQIPVGRPGPYFTVGQLDGIVGHVTEFPMYFLSEEVLTGFDKEGVLVDDVLFQ